MCDAVMVFAKPSARPCITCWTDTVSVKQAAVADVVGVAVVVEVGVPAFSFALTADHLTTRLSNICRAKWEKMAESNYQPCHEYLR